MIRFLRLGVFVLVGACSSSNADEPTATGVTALGAACVAHTNCASGSSCALSDDGTSSVCRPFCTTDNHCPTSNAPCVEVAEVDSEPTGTTTVTVCK